MKRFLILALCLCLAVSLIACGKKETPAPVATAPGLILNPEPTAVPTEVPTEPAPSLPAVDLIPSEQCSFTVTGTELNEHLGLQIQVLCENNSDRPLMFSWNNVSVCGFMYDPLWAIEVAPGKKANSTIGIDTYALEKIGINNVEEISFTLTVRDSEEFMEAPIVEESYSLYPTGKNAETVKLPQYRHRDGETVIVDNEDLTFIIYEVDDELADYYTLHCYAANRTGKDILLFWEDVSVNGFMVNPYWSVSIAQGKQAYSEIIFFRSDLEKQDIEVVQDIEFRLQASDNNDWSADYLFDGVYTFKPQQ